METTALLDHFQIQKKLGKGTTATVYLARNIDTNEQVALKIVRTKRKPEFLRESNFAECMPKHTNILEIKAAVKNGKYSDQPTLNKRVSYLVQEFASKGDVFQYVAKLGRFPEKIAHQYFRQILSGLSAVHSEGMYHGDLKPENLLLDDDYTLKLADFGFSEREAGDLKLFRGTEGYMSPEILARIPYSGQRADVFAAVVILFIMVVGRPPFVRAIPNDPHYKPLAFGDVKRFWMAQRVNLSSELYDLFTRCLQPNPQNRPTIQQILEHPWMAKPLATSEVVKAFMS